MTALRFVILWVIIFFYVEKVQLNWKIEDLEKRIEELESVNENDDSDGYYEEDEEED